MFKFVNKRGELVPRYSSTQDAPLGVPVADHRSTRPKDRADNCTVCKTRRRSLDRQKAQVLRRSRSRETLQSSSTDSSDVNHCEQPQDHMSSEVSARGTGVWSAKADKYRRLSRSCEVLSFRKKSSHRQSEDRDENTTSHSKELYINGAGNPGCIDYRNINPSKIDRSKMTMEEEQSLMRKYSNTKRFTPPSDCKTRHLQPCKGADYTDGECYRGNEGSTDALSRPSGSMPERGASSPSVKQVQFAARVEYERSKEDSVIGKLRNAVNNSRRKLRSRSLERIDRRQEWNREWEAGRAERASWMTRLRKSKSNTSSINNGDLTSRPDETDRNLDRETLQLNGHCNERSSRSRSKEYRDWTQDYCITKPHKIKMYSCNDNTGNLVSSQASNEEVLNATRKRSKDDYKQRAPRDNGPTYERHGEMRYNRRDAAESSTNCSTRQNRSQFDQESSGLISPQYVAPHGHYGKAVVRKCHSEQKQSRDLNQTSKNIKPLSPASCTRENLVSSSTKSSSQLKGTASRCSVPYLDKFGISAKKIAKLDSPLHSKATNVSLDVIEALSISNKHSMDVNGVSNCSVHSNIEAKSANVSVDVLTGNEDNNVTQNRQPNSLGYVYNCTTAKITKLGKPATHKQQNWKQERPQEQSTPHMKSPTEQGKRTAIPDGLILQEISPNDTRKNKPTANNLTRHASVASLSLISVNSVDSGTSCHEGSMTDSSDRELEAYAYSLIQQKPKSNTTNREPGSETRPYKSSSKELENLILGSCFGVDKHGSTLVTSDYESDTGPDMARGSLVEETKRRKGGASRVVRFVGGKDDADLTQELHTQNQQLRIQGPMDFNHPAAATKPKHSGQSTSSTNRLLTKLTTTARVLHNHKALSKAEMSVHRGDVVYLSREEFEQRPQWIVAYSSSSKQVGLIPSKYLATGKMAEII